MIEEVAVENVTLRKQVFSGQFGFSDEILSRLKEEATGEIIKDLYNNTFYNIRSFILGQFLESRTLTCPATWWDAVKIRFFPAWLIKRYPAKMTSVKIDAVALYPQISIPRDQYHTEIAILKYEQNYETSEGS